MTPARGTLYVVATPIGNLDDITLRALRILKEADLIACEDTRQTRKLLDHYGIAKRTVSYHEHNEAERARALVGELEHGVTVALVSDAGMPGISDPGYRVVSLAAERGIAVVPVPGAAAFVAALAASGLPTDSFRFGGFLPAKAGARRDALAQIRESTNTEIFYEAPHRLLEALEDVVELLGNNRPVVVARELTKLHEEFLRGPAGKLLGELRDRPIKGECTLLIGKAEAGAAAEKQEPEIAARLRQVMAERKLDEKSALKMVAKELGLSRSEAYRRLQRARR
ncbi:MAG TPA: 16S rRNA (cytidine(1402)-2'-O)-methyltransferase [Terriglobales bacterium]|nr:16S rRNA (cytidine(1402)-2'-O)-methyltransferase [Terriglobales bacterium]